jgi:putative tricarboxylic transport membrane protein
MELLIFILLGVCWGLVFGVIPTAGPTTALLTSYMFFPYFYSDPYLGVAFYTAMVAACTTGDTWSSILLGIPGSSSSAATVIDGYPLAQKGKATFALSAAFTSSTVNGLLFGCLVFLFMPVYSKLLLIFGIPELLMLNILALTAVIFLIKGKISLGVISILIGFVFGYVGIDENNAPRLTFGTSYLEDGISILIFAAGLFAVPELFDMFIGKTKLQKLDSSWKQVKLGFFAYVKYWKVSLRGGIIGAIVGAIPGVHGIVADWLAYTQTRATYPNRKFGNGNIAGVVGPEGANNAVHAASFVPTVVFGIPGTPFAAVILSIFYLLHFDLGSVSIQEDTDFYKYLAIGFLGGTVLVGILCVALSKPITVLLKIPSKIYAPLILLLICWSCYQISHTFYDIATLAVCSAIGLLSKRLELNRPAMLLAFILFSKIEALTIQTVSLYNIDSLINRPIFIVMFIVTLLIAYAGVRYVRK